jgi:hypothetical protein
MHGCAPCESTDFFLASFSETKDAGCPLYQIPLLKRWQLAMQTVLATKAAAGCVPLSNSCCATFVMIACMLSFDFTHPKIESNREVCLLVNVKSMSISNAKKITKN